MLNNYGVLSIKKGCPPSIIALLIGVEYNM